MNMEEWGIVTLHWFLWANSFFLPRALYSLILDSQCHHMGVVLPTHSLTQKKWKHSLEASLGGGSLRQMFFFSVFPQNFFDNNWDPKIPATFAERRHILPNFPGNPNTHRQVIKSWFPEIRITHSFLPHTHWYCYYITSSLQLLLSSPW